MKSSVAIIRLHFLALLTLVCLAGKGQQVNKNTLSGYIRESGSGEFLIGATVYIPKYKNGTVANVYGFYSITLPADTFEIIVSYVGYTTRAFRIDLRSPVNFNIDLERATTLQEVVISANKYQKQSETTQMSVIEIPVSQVKDIPALLGEKDVLKVIQLLPGVQKGSEGNSGLYVRGGGPDQNLIILDDAIVYNAFHLFGFFSLFNGDALRSIELVKGGFPARYGGRLSSVLDMSMKEGNKESYHGDVGIGLISTRATFEGPLKKTKSSFLVSGRRTYADALYRPFLPSGYDGGYYFYDLNVKLNYEFSEKDRIYLSGYFGRDKFFFSSKEGANLFEGGINWGNATATLRWNHLYNNKLFSNTSLIFSDYTFENYITTTFETQKFMLRYSTGIQDWSFKHDIDYRPAPAHSIRAGVHAIYHRFTPNALVVEDNAATEQINNVRRLYAWENAVYIEDVIKVGSRVRLNPGIRLTHFAPKEKSYINLEPRLNIAYQFKSDIALKASYAIMNQYIHLLSNTGVGLPTDLWVPSTNNLNPQRSQQVAAGIVKDFEEKEFSVSVEGYYKKSDGIIAYKEGASFLEAQGADESGATFNWEQNVTSGQGWSYGLELFVQKKTGRFTGWIGYTLSWTQLQFDELNNGNKFYARYDRRHDLSLVGMYKLRKEEKNKNGISLASTWVYGTGNAITLPIGDYNAPVHQPGNALPAGFNYYVSQYTGRNDFRMAPYHRWDIGVQFLKKFPKYVRTIEVSVYNLYSRQNPFFYFIGSKDGGFLPGRANERVLKQVSLFPIIPSISWNIKF
ncbi:MAG: TonB-dependent receptor [Sphingobacteriales bacterium]|nr:TonB-dependent receptor [Sphingobacteriales bacterium]